MSRVLTIVSLLMVALVGGSTAALAEQPAAAFVVEAEDGFLTGINAARQAEGLPTVVLNTGLRDVARGWTLQMAAADTLSHNPDYTTQYTGEWSRMSENVGVSRGATNVERIVASLDQAFLNSPGHRRNIMGDYNQIGIGVVANGSTHWVTVNFLQGPVPAEGQVGGEVSDEAGEATIGRRAGAAPAYYGRSGW